MEADMKSHVVAAFRKLKYRRFAAILLFSLAGVGLGLLYQQNKSPQNPPPVLVEQGDYGDFYRENAGQIVFYTLSTCPLCQSIKEILDAREVPYVERDIESSEKFLSDARLLNARRVPLLLIGSHKVEGYDPEKTIAVLQKEGFFPELSDSISP